MNLPAPVLNIAVNDNGNTGIAISDDHSDNHLVINISITGDDLNFDKKTINTTGNFSNVAFWDDNKQIIVGLDGFVTELTDGTKSWNVVDLPTQNNLNDIEFTKEGHAIVGGDNGTVMLRLDEPITINDAPSAPGQVHIFTTNATSLDGVSWSGVDNARSYTVSIKSRNETNFSKVASVPAPQTSYTIRNLNENTWYDIGVTAENDYGTSDMTIKTVRTLLKRPEIDLVTPLLEGEHTLSINAHTEEVVVINVVEYAVMGTAAPHLGKTSSVEEDTVFTLFVNLPDSVTEYELKDLEPGYEYFFRAKAVSDSNESKYSDTVSFVVEEPTDIEADNYLPNKYTLQQNYPNPFNPTTTIEYNLPFESMVKLEIYNILGQRVELLVNELQKVGIKQKIWNAGRMASGIYFVRLIAQPVNGGKNYQSVKKMILLK